MKPNTIVSVNDSLTRKRTCSFSVLLLGALSFFSSQARGYEYQNSYLNGYSCYQFAPFESPNLLFPSAHFESTSSLFTSARSSAQSTYYQPHFLNPYSHTPFASVQNGSTMSGVMSLADDFGDEEIGVVPIGEGFWFLAMLSLGYILFTQRKL